MSGFNSSTRDAAARSEAVGFTVHSMPAPELQADARRTRMGRVKMLLVLLVCAAPVVASYFSYFVLRPQARSNYGSLILPTRSLPALPLYTLDGEAVDAKSLHGQWLLLTLGAADCDGECQQRLYMQRQLREMVGRERERIDKIWLVTDGAELPATLRTALQADPALRVLRVPRAALAAWLQPEEGHALEQHLYLVDPMGEWMMRMPADPDPARVKRDLERLLRASSSWDLPGR
ncbi:MAG: transrane protein [Proteobacteria bacterium]|jgi:hypothetical protein|nr:transrane protein [Pseudomonadota bacterium]